MCEKNKTFKVAENPVNKESDARTYRGFTSTDNIQMLLSFAGIKLTAAFYVHTIMLQTTQKVSHVITTSLQAFE